MSISVELSILFHVYTNFLGSYIFRIEYKIRVCARAYVYRCSEYVAVIDQKYFRILSLIKYATW